LVLGAVGVAGSYLAHSGAGQKFVDEGKKRLDAWQRRRSVAAAPTAATDKRKVTEEELEVDAAAAAAAAVAERGKEQTAVTKRSRGGVVLSSLSDDDQSEFASAASTSGSESTDDAAPPLAQQSLEESHGNVGTSGVRSIGAGSVPVDDDDDLNDYGLISPLYSARSVDGGTETPKARPKPKASPVPRLPLFRFLGRGTPRSERSGRSSQPSDDGKGKIRTSSGTSPGDRGRDESEDGDVDSPLSAGANTSSAARSTHVGSFWRDRQHDADAAEAREVSETALAVTTARAAKAIESEIQLKLQLEHSQRQLAVARTRQRELEEAVHLERAAKMTGVERAAKVAAAAEALGGLASPDTLQEGSSNSNGGLSLDRGRQLSVTKPISDGGSLSNTTSANDALEPAQMLTANVNAAAIMELAPPRVREGGADGGDSSASTDTDDLRALRVLEQQAAEQLERADRALARAAVQKATHAASLQVERERWEAAMAVTAGRERVAVQDAAGQKAAAAAREAELRSMLDAQVVRETTLRSELEAALNASTVAAATATDAADALTAAAEKVTAAAAEEARARSGAGTPPGGVTPRTARVVAAESEVQEAKNAVVVAELAAGAAKIVADGTQAELEAVTAAAEVEITAAKARANELQLELDAAKTRQRESDASAASAAEVLDTVSKAAAADFASAQMRERKLRDALAVAKAKEETLKAQLAREDMALPFSGTSSDGNRTFDDANNTFASANTDAAGESDDGSEHSAELGSLLAGLTDGGGTRSSAGGDSPLVTPRPPANGFDSNDASGAGFNPSPFPARRALTSPQPSDLNADATGEALLKINALAERQRREIIALRTRLAETDEGGNTAGLSWASEQAAAVEALKAAHAIELEKRQGAHKTTREQLTETADQVRELRGRHERSAAEARAAEASTSLAESQARKAHRAGEAATRALQEAVHLAVASGASESDVRKALLVHGVVVYREAGELRVLEPDAATSGQRTPSVSASVAGGDALPASPLGAGRGWVGAGGVSSLRVTSGQTIINGRLWRENSAAEASDAEGGDGDAGAGAGGSVPDVSEDDGDRAGGVGSRVGGAGGSVGGSTGGGAGGLGLGAGAGTEIEMRAAGAGRRSVASAGGGSMSSEVRPRTPNL
jgi:hypothetical protein